jgi:cytoskeletal protein CcmA (bactofilin family)
VTTEEKVDLPPLEEKQPDPIPVPTPAPTPIPTPTPVPTIAKEERRTMSETTQAARQMMDARVNPAAVTEETSVITAGTTLTGDVASDGSFDIQGTINGNVTCNGKLVVTGTINGNSAASEIFADVAKIEGEVVSSGTVKIGAGSVIIGNISASSAVIAGAIKGDIDVQGPVVVDTSAVIMGNIKSRSVQINNGAVIEGFCSQCYAEIDVEGLFDGR